MIEECANINEWHRQNVTTPVENRRLAVVPVVSTSDEIFADRPRSAESLLGVSNPITLPSWGQGFSGHRDVVDRHH